MERNHASAPRSKTERLAPSLPLESVRGTARPELPSVHDVCVNHRRAQVDMTEELLNRADIDATLEEMRGKRVPQRMARRRLGDSGLADGRRERPL